MSNVMAWTITGAMVSIVAIGIILKQLYDKKKMTDKEFQAKMDKRTSPQRTILILIAGFALVGFAWLA